MSYASPADALKRPLHSPTTAGDSTASPYERDCKKIQDAVQRAQQCAADIRRQTAGGITASSRAQVEEAVRTAKATTEEARRVLENLALASGGEAATAEQNMRQLMQQKLTDNLKEASRAVEHAATAFRAEGERASRSKALTAGKEGVELTTIEPQEPLAADLEAGRARQAQQVEDAVTAATIHTHAEIVDEYVHDLTRVQQNMSALQDCMINIAEVASAQGATLNSIEGNMITAEEHTSRGREQVVIASQAQQRSNKRVACAVLTAASITASLLALSLS